MGARVRGVTMSCFSRLAWIPLTPTGSEGRPRRVGNPEIVIAKRVPDGSNDSVNLLVSLLVRHPELSRVVIKPRFASIALFFVIRSALSKIEQRRFTRSILDHLRAFHQLDGSPRTKIAVRLLVADGLTFVEIERDAKTLARDEISLIVSLVAQSFGDGLFVNPPADDAADDDFGPDEDSVNSALDAVRRGKQRKSLVGFREERRVLVYFGK